MIDKNELVLATYGFTSVEAWKMDEYLGMYSAEDLMQRLGYKSMQEWDTAVMPLHRQVQKELIDALKKLWSAIGKPVNPDQMRVYFEAFKTYPPEVLNAAIDRILKTYRYSNIPTIAELIEACADR